MDETYTYALKLLRARDYSVARLRQKLEDKFGEVPQLIFDQLIGKNFLNDRRFAENHVARRKNRGAAVLREELLARGIAPELTDEIVSGADWPSLREALAAKMKDWKLRPPLQSRDAARLFRALHRLGYDEDAVREAIEQVR
jgi:SOS response regulatory protein OraA/RecX